ncbi:MAG: hypothetical protein ACE5JL_02850 [Dehalococcoidia bacterium]
MRQIRKVETRSVKGILKKTAALPVAVDRWMGAINGAPVLVSYQSLGHARPHDKDDWYLYTFIRR